MENYYLQIVLDKLFNSKQITKQDFINILNFLVINSNNKIMYLKTILSEKKSKLKKLQSNYMLEKENKEQIEKLQKQIINLEHDITQKKHINMNFVCKTTVNNKLIIIFKKRNLTNNFNYDEFI